MSDFEYVVFNTDGSVYDVFRTEDLAKAYAEPGMQIVETPIIDDTFHNPFDRDQTYKED